MMKLKDFFCLFAGIALLALAFVLKGYGEEYDLQALQSSVKSIQFEQAHIDHPHDPLQFCKENRENEVHTDKPVFLKIK